MGKISAYECVMCARARGAGGTHVRVAKQFWVRESSHIGRKRSCTATHKADKQERTKVADREHYSEHTRATVDMWW